MTYNRCTSVFLADAEKYKLKIFLKFQGRVRLTQIQDYCSVGYDLYLLTKNSEPKKNVVSLGIDCALAARYTKIFTNVNNFALNLNVV